MITTIKAVTECPSDKKITLTLEVDHGAGAVVASGTAPAKVVTPPSHTTDLAKLAKHLEESLTAIPKSISKPGGGFKTTLTASVKGLPDNPAPRTHTVETDAKGFDALCEHMVTCDRQMRKQFLATV